MTSLINFSGPVNMEITVRAFAARLVRQTIQFTKTLIAVLAIPLAMHTASGEERLSKNIVGYVRLPLAPGDNLIANPLNGTNNHLNTVLRLAGDGSQDNAQIFRWNVAAQTFYGTVTWFGGFGWLSDDLTPTSFILNPGEAFFFRNPLSNSFDATFVGEVPQGMLTNPLPAPGQIAFLSSIVPQTARIGSASAPGTLMFPAFNGDEIQILDPLTQTYTTNQYVSGLGWDPGHPQGPTIPVATGFLVQKNGGASNWITFFGVNENGPPQITQQPQSQIVNSSGTAVLDFGVAGAFPLSYQWHVNCRDIPRATNATLVISNFTAADVGTYSVTVSNVLGQTTSWDAALELTNVVFVPRPALLATLGTTNALLSWPVSAGAFQLQEVSSLDVLPASWINSGAGVSIVGPNYVSSVSLTGTKKFFRLNGPPSGTPTSFSILTHPLGRSANLGDNVTLSVTATGAPPLAYVWRFNGQNLPAATNATLTVALTNLAQFGAYGVWVIEQGTNEFLSRPAVLRTAGLETNGADFFADRTTFTNLDGSIHGITFGATKQAGELDHAGQPGGRSVWVQWRPPATGIATFDTDGSGFDTLLAAYTGSSLSNLLLLDGNDDGGDVSSRVRFNVSSNVNYQIAVDGLAGAGGFFVLNWSLDVQPADVTLPVIETQPRDAILNTNVSVVTNFTVVAHALPPLSALSYQWYYDDAVLTNATNATLIVGTGGVPLRLGNYSVDVNNSARVLRSRAASLQFSTDPGLRFWPKPEADLICGDTAGNNSTNCCGAGFAGGGKGGLPSSFEAAATGSCSAGTVANLANPASTPSTWKWVRDMHFSSASTCTLTLTAQTTGGVNVPGCIVVRRKKSDGTYTTHRYSSTLPTPFDLVFTNAADTTFDIATGSSAISHVHTVTYTKSP